MLLSKEKNPPINAVIKENLVPYFIRFLTREENTTVCGLLYMHYFDT